MSSNKTEEPTPKRLRDARKEGDVARSADFSGAMVFMAGILFLVAGLQDIVFGMLSFMRGCLKAAGTGPSPGAMVGWLHEGILKALTLVLPLLGVVAAVAVLVTFAQVGPLFVPVKLRLKRLDPVSGAKQLVKPERWMMLILSVLKLGFAGFIGVMVVRRHLREILSASGSTSGHIMHLAAVVLQHTALAVAGTFLLIGTADLFYQRRKWRKKLMMTKDEVKREYKEMEGDPVIKGMRRQLREQLLQQNAVQAVRKARVVVVNPTHIAVALRYDESEDPAPRVVAKGRRKIAGRIRAEAVAAGVPVIRNRRLARRLLHVPLNDIIPEKLFEAVAEVIIFLEELDEKQRASLR